MSSIYRSGITLLLAAIGLLFLASGQAQNPRPNQIAVATAHELATDVGIRIMEQGGNAFDAAVAVSAALAVVEPASSGAGGGGFWLLSRASDGMVTMVDGRETAPAAAHADMYLDADGNVERDLAINGPLAAGIPGAPAAWVHIAETYGSLPLADLLAPAITLAEQGYEVDQKYQALLNFRAHNHAALAGNGGDFHAERGGSRAGRDYPPTGSCQHSETIG